MAGDISENDDPEAESKEDVELFVYMAMKNDVEEEEIAAIAQAEATSFVAWNKFGKGRKKGKGKGKGKKPFRFSHYSNGRAPNSKTLEERKEALKKLKSKTKCKECVALGHWAGDAECPKKGSKKFGGLAIVNPTFPLFSFIKCGEE